ncbi:hypothetical protein AS29_017730 [Bacillus sp. SJS]|nr:hypothetical protein AS29_017730 [Bacillus sp. SJS]
MLPNPAAIPYSKIIHHFSHNKKYAGLAYLPLLLKQSYPIKKMMRKLYSIIQSAANMGHFYF